MATAPRPDSIPAIAQRLRLLRLAFGVVQGYERQISQSEMARRCGLGTVQAWHNAEAALNRIGIDSAILVCRATGASLDYIYLGNTSVLPRALAVEIEKAASAKAQTKPATKPKRA